MDSRRTKFNNQTRIYALKATNPLSTEQAHTKTQDTVTKYSTAIKELLSSKKLAQAELPISCEFIAKQQSDLRPNLIGTIALSENHEDLVRLELHLVKQHDMETIEMRTNSNGKSLSVLGDALNDRLQEAIKLVHEATDRDVSFADFEADPNKDNHLQTWTQALKQALRSPYLLLKEGWNNITIPFASIVKQGSSIEFIKAEHPRLQKDQYQSDMKIASRDSRIFFKKLASPPITAS